MKTTNQIASDCGLLRNERKTYLRVMEQTHGSAEPYPAVLEDIIERMHHRILKLEEDKNEALSMLPRVMDYVQYYHDREGCGVTLQDLINLIAKHRKEEV